MASKIIVDQIEKTGGSLTALTLPTSNASASEFLQNDGAGALSWASASAGFNSVQIFTASGTWTRPAGITKVVIEVQGGGGGGGVAPTSYPEYTLGGSGGGYAKKFIDVSSVTASVVSVGAAGVGSSTAGGAAGTDGGDSSWVDTASGGSSTVTGVKGVGGYASYGIVVGGAATGGDINMKGGDAGWGGQYGTLAGASILGNAGKNGYVTSGISTAGSGYGAGGGGRYINTPASDGAPGIVIVWEYK